MDIGALSPSHVALGLLAAFGMFLVTSAVGLPHFPKVRLPRGKHESLAAEEERLRGSGPRDASALPLIDRAIAPLARRLMLRDTEAARGEVERALDLLNYPSPFKTLADYYGAKVLLGATGFAIGALVGLAASGLSLLILAILPVVSAAIGYAVPSGMLNSMLQERRERILFELPYALDRLIVTKMARNSLPAAFRSFEDFREGGYVAQEFRQVASDVTRPGVTVVAALERMAERNADAPLLARAAARLAQCEAQGLDMAKPMGVLGERAREQVENTIRARGELNKTLMIVPTIIALIGILVAVAAPAMAGLGSFFGRGM